MNSEPTVAEADPEVPSEPHRHDAPTRAVNHPHGSAAGPAGAHLLGLKYKDIWYAVGTEHECPMPRVPEPYVLENIAVNGNQVELRLAAREDTVEPDKPPARYVLKLHLANVELVYG